MTAFLPLVRCWLAACALLLGLATPARAQFPTNPLNPNQPFNPAAPPPRPDTATVRKPTRQQLRQQAAADSARRTERLFGMRVTRPQKAGLLALLPGTGQLYNRRYWKVPIVYGMVGGLGYWVWYQQRFYKAYAFANTLSPGFSQGVTVTVGQQILNASNSQIPADLRPRISLEADNNPASLQTSLAFYRRYRDLSILFSALGYGLQILDAVVDAHLRDFDVGDDLSGTWQPTLVPVPGQAALAPGVLVALRFK